MKQSLERYCPRIESTITNNNNNGNNKEYQNTGQRYDNTFKIISVGLKLNGKGRRRRTASFAEFSLFSFF